MSVEAGIVAAPTQRLEALLVCPLCRGPLQPVADALRCAPCRRNHPRIDGFPDLRRAAAQVPESAMDLDEPDAREPSAWMLRQEESGRHIRRLRRELHILTHMLSTLPGSETLLDVACRGGRFSGPMQPAARLLVEADGDPSAVRHAVDHAMNPARVTGLLCDADTLPFADASVDGVVCIRPSHDFSSDSARESSLHEALRVATRFVVFSYTEHISLPNAWRRVRRRPPNPRSMSTRAVSAVAETHGARVEETAVVSPLGSRHRYSLLVKSR